MKSKILELLLGKIGPLLLKVFAILANKNTLNTCVELARTHVEALTGDKSLDNETKRKIAVEKLKADLKVISVEVGDSVINLAVELAVAAAKAKFN